MAKNENNPEKNVMDGGARNAGRVLKAYVDLVEELDAYHAVGSVAECEKAMEKQKAKKPEHVIYYPQGRKHHMIYCGACAQYRQRVYIGDNFCRECGTKIDWEE